MNVYVLVRASSDYDEYIAMAIVAESEDRARQIANKNSGLEGKVWDKTATCEVVDTEKEQLILQEFRC